MQYLDVIAGLAKMGSLILRLAPVLKAGGKINSIPTGLSGEPPTFGKSHTKKL